MSWQHWAIVALLTFEIVSAPSGIGKPREPKSVTLAISNSVVFACLLILLVWGQS